MATYKVRSAITHDGKTFKPGDKLEADKALAASLIASGALVDPDSKDESSVATQAAEAEAQKIVADAKTEAEKLLTDAKAEAESIVVKAKEDADKTLADAKTEAEKLKKPAQTK